MKNLIQQIYMAEANENFDKISILNNQIVEQLNENKFYTILNNEADIKIPHGNDNNYLIAIYTDIGEVEKAKDYYKFNEIEYTAEKEISISDYEKIIKEDSYFLGFQINIANLSYFVDKNYL